MNKFKRITAMFMVILTLFSSLCLMTVNAATEGTKTTIDASYRCRKGSDIGTSGPAQLGDSNYYWHYDSTGIYLNSAIRFMKEEGTGLPIYCIEVGATFDGYTYDTKSLTDSPYWNNLPYAAQAGVTYATMYGYPVNNYGAASCDAYAATQTIIWEFVQGYRDLNGRTNAYYYNLMIKDSPAEDAYNQLSADIIAHNKRPSFAYTTTSTAAKNKIELKFNSANNNWSATLTDANGVLSSYQVTSGGGLTVSKSGNTLTLTTNSELNGTAQIELARPLPSTGQALLTLYSTSSQNALIGQLQDPVTSYMTITTKNVKGKISVNKVNENGTPLNEITFAIYEDEECLTPLLGADGKQVMMTTDENGVATSEGIEVNNNGSRMLYVKEHCISEVHGDSYVLDNTVYPVVITAGTVAKVNGGKEIVNKWSLAKVSLYKVNPAGDGINGAQFTVYTDAECTTPLTDENGETVIVFTDPDGFGISNPIKVSKDGTLTVFLKETAVEDTRVKLNPTVFEVKLIAGEITEANNGEVIVDDWKPSKLELYKLNENGDMLEGVTFGVYDDIECTSAAMDASGKAIVLVTNKDGYAISNDVYVNKDGSRKLFIKEIRMTEEQQKLYSMVPVVFEVDLKPGETVAVNNGMGIVNEWLDATLSLVKQDEDGNLMSGVTFAVYEDEECTVSSSDISGKDLILVTDENGYAKSEPIETNAHGNRIVFVKEIGMTVSDSDIYDLNNEVWMVELSAGQNTEVNDGENIVNCFKTAPVKIKKSDMTTAEGVPGAAIQIFDSNGTMVYEGVTLEDGNTEEIELRVGKYTFVETIAPAGYVLNKTVFEFSVNPDRTVTGDCEVQDKPTEWTITKSDVTTAEPLSGAEITIYDAEGKEVYKDITKEDGTITAFYLPAGEYTFKETLAPEGYVINEEIFSFTVDAEGNVTGDNTVTDRKIKGNIKVIKTDEETGKVLAGAVFGLFASDGKTKLAERTTGEDGFVIFADMEYGDYCVKEIKAPIGYESVGTSYEVSIREEGVTVDITVKNRSKKVYRSPDTGDSESANRYAFFVMAIVCSLVTMIAIQLIRTRKISMLCKKIKLKAAQINCKYKYKR